MSARSVQSLLAVASAIDQAIERQTQSQRRLLDHIRRHAERLREATFQIAVVGQFKRGKSALLNAFLGFPLLSSGVLPLTAVSTFLSSGSSLQIRFTYLTGAVEESNAASLSELASAVAEATTEEGNPHNTKKLERVDVTVPDNAWLGNFTLIDTPGIGSTYKHNTEAAHAVLPECDAALFVVSVDPPITEVEVQYLATICQTVARVIVVLNKIDLVDPRDLEKAIQFLAETLSQRGESRIDTKIFQVSAQCALVARQEDDKEALKASGVPALVQYIRSSLVDRKLDHLMDSIAGKIFDALITLEADIALTFRSLTIPLNVLDEKIDIFESAVTEFEHERDRLHDLLSGEWRRAIEKLANLCDEAGKRASLHLETTLDDIKRSMDPKSDREIIESVMSTIFDREFKMIGAAVDTDLAAAVEEHQRGYHALVRRVRETASALMDIPVSSSFPDNWFQLKRESYWVGQARTESLGALTLDSVTKLLPAALRRRRELQKLRQAVGDAVTRNVSSLQWVMRQNIDDSFRRLLSSSSEEIDASLNSTLGVLAVARERRQHEDESLHCDVQYTRGALDRLTHLRAQLEQDRPCS